MHSTGFAGKYRRSTVQDNKIAEMRHEKVVPYRNAATSNNPAIYGPPTKGQRQVQAGDDYGDNFILFFFRCSNIEKMPFLVKGIFFTCMK